MLILQAQAAVAVVERVGQRLARARVVSHDIGVGPSRRVVRLVRGRRLLGVRLCRMEWRLRNELRAMECMYLEMAAAQLSQREKTQCSTPVDHSLRDARSRRASRCSRSVAPPPRSWAQ